jgi:hypothetical protein
MRRPLLTLLALLVLLTQPAALLHALSHGPVGVPARATAGATEAAAVDTGDPHAASGLECLQCLAFAAIGSAALPAALLLFRTPPLRHAAPGGRAGSMSGGTGAGYHARGPPRLT